MKLYPYQQKIFDETIRNFKTSNRQLIVVPTGGGKTVIFSHLAKFFNLKTLIIAHTKELITQAEKTLKMLNVRNAVAFSIQKACLNLSRLDDYQFIIFDECHRSGAPSYQKIINRFSSSKILGVTATPFRNDGQKLEDIFGKKICPISLLEMIESGLLSNFQGFRVMTDISLRGVSTKGGEFIASRLASVVNVKNRNSLIVREYLKLAPQEKTLCFAVNIDHSNELAAEFRKNGISSKSIHGLLSKNIRSQIIQDFQNGRIQVLVNCQILTEGFDEPSITCLLMARPTCSKVLYTQMIGRGSRLFPGKNCCKVIEFTDNEYDVSCIEDLVELPNKRFKIIEGEKLSSFSNRVKKQLEDETHTTFVEKMNIISPFAYEKPATSWQLQFLRDKNIIFSEGLTQTTANHLILKEYNGNN